MCDYIPVADFYKGESVFITGGTGFLGKVVIEKLLYSCPGIGKIYVLMRKKQHSDVYQRLQDIFKQPMFTRLKNLRPEALDKIIPVTGDISEASLGLSAADEKVIRDNVSIIFHVAANVKFHEPLEVAMNVNVMGTFRALELFRRLENRKAFVYVSTAYTNFERMEIEERMYPPPASIKEVKTALENGITEDEVKELLKCKPNTYVFTKSIAESFVAENHVDLPITIVRPSIISSCQSEPIPGWIDTWVGATALMTTTAKGFNRVLFAKPENSLDLIPVDYVSNLTIVAAAKGIKTGEVTVYNSSTCGVNPISIKEFVDLSIAESVKTKFNDVPLPGVLYTSKTWILTTLTVLLQVIPAFIADVLLFVTGKNTRFSKLQTKVEYIRKMVDFYTIRSWRISAAKTGALAQTLSSSDRTEFPFDPLDINWKEYVPIYLNGVGKFLLNTKKH